MAGSSLLSYAAQAVSRGWHIFPVEPGGKMPHKIWPDKEYRIKWGDAATNDLGKVVQWWTWSPEANIGIAAKPSGLLVIDLDTAKEAGSLRDSTWGYLHDRLGPYVDGDDVLREMCQRFGGDGEYDRLMKTYRVCTASMGAHIYLAWPEGVQASQASPVPKAIDIRCNGGQRGGYVLGPGSITSKGSYFVEHDGPVLPATDFPWLVELCRERPKAAKVKPLFSQAGGGGYSGLRDAVRLAQEGNRNNCLLWAARSMCEDGATQEECEDLLVPAAQEAGQTEREARDTIRSAYRLQGSRT